MGLHGGNSDSGGKSFAFSVRERELIWEELGPRHGSWSFKWSLEITRKGRDQKKRMSSLRCQLVLRSTWCRSLIEPWNCRKQLAREAEAEAEAGFGPGKRKEKARFRIVL